MVFCFRFIHHVQKAMIMIAPMNGVAYHIGLGSWVDSFWVSVFSICSSSVLYVFNAFWRSVLISFCRSISFSRQIFPSMGPLSYEGQCILLEAQVC